MKTLIKTFLLFTLTFLLGSHAAFAQPNEPGSGNCLEFDGVNDCLEKTSPVSLSIDNQSWTVSAWLKTTSNSQGMVVTRYECGWNCGGSSRALYTLYISGGKARFRLRDDNSQNFFAASTSIVSDGSWHHISGVLNRGNSTSKIYIDGVEENSISVAGITSIIDGGSPLEIGRWFIQGWGSPILYFNGQIDEVRVWNYARSQTQIQEDMCQKLTGSETGLVGYWRLDEGSGNTAFDSSPNSNDGTLY